MKINQLFSKFIELDLLLKLLECFGIHDINNKKVFCKYDMIQLETVQKIKELRPVLEHYYLPCKAKIYLDVDSLNEKRAVSILKQILRLHDYYLFTREKNVNNKKVIYYQIISKKERFAHHMTRMDMENILSFD
jgi:hypothetical protein